MTAIQLLPAALSEHATSHSDPVKRAPAIVRGALFVLWICLLCLGGADRLQASDAAWQARFETAVLARAEGDYDAAIKALRALLREQPDNLAARQELGYALILDGQYAAAQYHFEILAARTPSDDDRALYRAVLRRIYSERPFGLDLILAWVPSSNLNGGSSEASLDTALGVLPIDDGSRAVSGWSQTVGLGGYARAPLDLRNRVIFSWSATNTRYSDLLEDERQLEAAVTWQHVRSRNSYALRLGWLEQEQADERRQQEAVTISGSHLQGRRGRIDWSLSQANDDYRFRPTKNGDEKTASFRYNWLLPRNQTVWLGLLLEDGTREADHLSLFGTILQAGGRKVFRNGVSIDTTISFGDRDFDGVFPLQSVAREDRFTEISIFLQDSRINWKGFTPRTKCRSRFNTSNIALFDATTYECSLELTHRF
ncbi:MAG: porin family protein [Pseudomonadota bacterium]